MLLLPDSVFYTKETSWLSFHVFFFSCALNNEVKLRRIMHLRCGLHVTGFCHSFETECGVAQEMQWYWALGSDIWRERGSGFTTSGWGGFPKSGEDSQNHFCLPLGMFTEPLLRSPGWRLVPIWPSTWLWLSYFSFTSPVSVSFPYSFSSFDPKTRSSCHFPS